MTIKLNNASQEYSLNSDNTFELINSLSNPKEESKSISVSNISPGFILSNLPANYTRFSIEGIISYPVPISFELDQLLTELNDTNPYFCHCMGILYVSPNNNLSMKEIYSERTASPKFNKFLSQLGALIKVETASKSDYIGKLPRSGADGLYGILWKDRLMRVFFYVNTLMQYTNGPKEDQIEKIKEYVKGNNIVIVWNESLSGPLSRSLLKQINKNIVIVITPLNHDLYKINVNTKIAFGNKKSYLNMFGPLAQSNIIHEHHLRKIMLNAAIAMDIRAQQVNAKEGENFYASSFVKREQIITEIKTKAWREGCK